MRTDVGDVGDGDDDDDDDDDDEDEDEDEDEDDDDDDDGGDSPTIAADSPALCACPFCGFFSCSSNSRTRR